MERQRACGLILEPECSFALTYGYSSSDFDDVVVECLAYVIEIRENEGFAHVETYGNDVLGIFAGKFLDIIDCQVLFEEEFLIVSELDYERDIKDVL